MLHSECRAAFAAACFLVWSALSGCYEQSLCDLVDEELWCGGTFPIATLESEPFGVPPSPADTDGDAIPDHEDACPTDPDKVVAGLCGCGTADIDTDGDDTPDCAEGCPDDPDKIAPGVCGCGVPDDRTDSDGDGAPDCADECPIVPDVQVFAPEGAEYENCTDGIDNNCNGLPDAADPACPPPPDCACGDLVPDNRVGNADFAMFSICFRLPAPTEQCPLEMWSCADLNQDGRINLEDFNTFAMILSLSPDGIAPPDCTLVD